MELRYTGSLLLVATGLMFSSARCQYTPPAGNAVKIVAKTDADTAGDNGAGLYRELRNMALQANPDSLGIRQPAGKNGVYGVVMDWGMGEATVTLAAYASGDASLYFSTGGGIVGGGSHESVSTAAQACVRLADSFVEKASPLSQDELPRADELRFYLLTKGGIVGGSEQLANFKNRTSAWLPLFEKANEVISALRAVQQ